MVLDNGSSIHARGPYQGWEPSYVPGEPQVVHYAQAYLNLGFSIIRLHGATTAGRCTCGKRGCQDTGKHPDVGPGWKRFRREPAGIEQVRRWFDEKPYANVGIVTGEVSGIVVVDADGQAGVAELERRGYPTTWTARSGSGGVHAYFRYPGYPVRNRKIQGIGDLTADGGYIVAPPSRHASGGCYEWLPGCSPW
jgi:Bifunctional DNA primase/polymerase, N-terminal